MDYLLRSNENNSRVGLQAAGQMLSIWGSFLSTNPFLQPWARTTKELSHYLTVKGKQISSWPWHTKNRVVYNERKTALRLFTSGNRENAILFVPPEAGHNSQIVDFGPGQSLVGSALDHFDGDIYVLEKLPAQLEDADYSLDDCIRSLDQCVQHIGKPVHLAGLCQGGWQSVIYTALFPENVKTLTLAGAPIDFHAGNGCISQLARSLPMSFFKSMVAINNGLMPGALITMGFKMMHAFDRFVGDDVALYQNLSNPEYVERHTQFSRWYDYTQPLSGRMYLEVVEQLFKENKLVKGLLEIMGRRVDLSRIYHPIYLIAGRDDDITLPEQLFALREHVSSEPIWQKSVEAGHIGVFIRSIIIDTVWARLFKSLKSKPLPSLLPAFCAYPRHAVPAAITG